MIEKQIMDILNSQELFKTVNVLDAKYTVIYRSSEVTLVIKSKGFDDQEVSDFYYPGLSCRQIPRITLELYMPALGGVAVTYGGLTRKKSGSNYLVCKASKWYDQPESRLILLAIPEEITNLNIEQSTLALFCSHLQECEDRLIWWTTLKRLD